MYILETKLPDNKSIYFSLTGIYGIGLYTSTLICKKLGFSLNFKTKNLDKDQILHMIKIINSLNLPLNNELKKLKTLSLKKLINIKAYRGLRRLKGLPVRGQRTHTNAKSSRKIKNL
jgi:small subunit ribosomal protein S13